MLLRFNPTCCWFSEKGKKNKLYWTMVTLLALELFLGIHAPLDPETQLGQRLDCWQNPSSAIWFRETICLLLI